MNTLHRRNARFIPFLSLFILFALGTVADDVEGCPSGLACWGFSICNFVEADGARKQQYGATALVMGLVPLTLCNIAWPRAAALGLEPTLATNVEEERIWHWLSWMHTGWLTNIKAK
ncbi:hypothetical protein BDV27DRAFT_160611 [Aspergillus caelatus]|uniref:Uncharacterized protein n=1 Tax=Aspergillus caelatus TaxID=61420 RepID=A0A5N6ZVI1_9EURO|nr:uncharacterized protein BDV27DRAFT_160611 [Aspergillus caelatus]KAE8361567.1 hypothetical protein BDV27DRAFT_160611 [Aspergillus caelatus]